MNIIRLGLRLRQITYKPIGKITSNYNSTCKTKINTVKKK